MLTHSSSSPIVRTIARLALPLGSRLVAGELGLTRSVKWARTSGVLSPIFPTLNAGEIALLDLPIVQASNPNLTLSRIVRGLGQVRLAGIGVKGAIDPMACREAERSNMPLFALPSDADITRTARAIIRLIQDREAQEEAQAAALYRYLSQSMIMGKGLSGLVNDLHRLSGHAVRISDMQGDTLAIAHSAHPMPNGKELTRSLFIGGNPIAMLTLRDTPDMLDKLSHIALEQGAAALTLELVKMEAVEAAKEGVHGDFVSTLLLGEDESLLQARARTADYPLEAAQWVVLAVTDAKMSSEEMMKGWMRRANAHCKTLGWQVRMNLTKESRSRARVKKDQTLQDIHLLQLTMVLAGGGDRWSLSRAAFVNYLNEIETDRSLLTLAAGEPAPGIAGLRHSLTQANDALSLGLRLFGQGRTYLYREMGLYRLLRHLQGTDDLNEFLDRTLFALDQYDKTHHTELVTTLEALLNHGGNVSATAKAMHLHRNSLIYRIERIRHIAGLDPINPDDSFTLKLALMLAPLR